MIGVMTALALVLAGRQVDGAVAGIAPDARLDAFRAACVPHRRDLERAAEALAADGWARVGDDDHPSLEQAMTRARAEAVDPDLNMTATFSTWARDFGGRRFHVVLNRVDAVIGETRDEDGDGIIEDWERARTLTFLGCGLWDFDAEAAIHPGLITAWAGGLPVASVDRPGEIEGGTWNVHAMLPGTGEVKASFIPPGSPHVAMTGFSGLAITLTSAPEGGD